MIKLLKKFFYRPICNHENHKWNHEIKGVTLGWGLDPVVYFKTTNKCPDCGKVWYTSGYHTDDVLKIFHPEIYRNERGWPCIDGKEIEICKEDELI